MASGCRQGQWRRGEGKELFRGTAQVRPVSLVLQKVPLKLSEGVLHHRKHGTSWLQLFCSPFPSSPRAWRSRCSASRRTSSCSRSSPSPSHSSSTSSCGARSQSVNHRLGRQARGASECAARAHELCACFSCDTLLSPIGLHLRPRLTLFSRRPFAHLSHSAPRLHA